MAIAPGPAVAAGNPEATAEVREVFQTNGITDQATPDIAVGADGLTARERADLSALVRKRERVAKTDAKQRAAELLADVEARLAARFKSNDERWAAVTVEAQKTVEAADQEIARICREIGVPEEFRPRLGLSWYSRGENADRERRAELRKVASTRIAAMELAARSEIERGSLDAQTALLAGGLTTDAARNVLAALPTVEALMPGLSVDELEAAVPIAAGRRP
jgi:hypothetical protein